jgi:hypothetical protein
MASSDLVVLLADDDRLVRDLQLYRKTAKFVRQAKMGSVQPSRDRIIDEKGEQNILFVRRPLSSGLITISCVLALTRG